MSSFQFGWKVIYRSDVDDRYITLAWKSRTDYIFIRCFLYFFSFSLEKTRHGFSVRGSSLFPSFLLYNAQLKYVDDSAQQFSLIFLLWPNICGLIYYPLFLSLSFFPTRFGLMVQSFTSSQLYSSTSSSSLVLSDCSRERESLPSCSAASGLQGILLSSHKYSERKKKKRFVYTLATVLLLYALIPWCGPELGQLIVCASFVTNSPPTHREMTLIIS